MEISTRVLCLLIASVKSYERVSRGASNSFERCVGRSANPQVDGIMKRVHTIAA